MGVDDEKFGQRLRAFVVHRDGASLSEDDIRSYVKENLANYKVPREVVFVDELPRNATGKVLKRELAEKVEEGEEGESKSEDGEEDKSSESKSEDGARAGSEDGDEARSEDREEAKR